MTSGSSTRPPKRSRADELVDFLQDVALGKRKATEQQIDDAQEELNQLLPDAEQ
jgi:hypothetical protein